jgi:hypothetical protein
MSLVCNVIVNLLHPHSMNDAYVSTNLILFITPLPNQFATTPNLSSESLRWARNRSCRSDHSSCCRLKSRIVAFSFAHCGHSGSSISGRHLLLTPDPPDAGSTVDETNVYT